jgi:hypothetical protein
MKFRPCFAAAILFTLIVIRPTASRAADVLQLVPRDALGFIVVNKLNTTDEKLKQLLNTLHANFPTPSVFLSDITGITEGIDANGSALVSVLPPGEPGAAPEFCVWLPVQDYESMLTALDAPRGEPISEFRLGQENLLVARHDDWALIMDADQRTRMSNLLAASPSPPPAIARYKDWINQNDAAAVTFISGIRSIIIWAAQAKKEQVDGVSAPIEEVVDRALQTEQLSPAAPDQLYAPIRAALADWITKYNKVTRLLVHSEVVGCAVRIDELGDALVSARVDARQNRTPSKNAAADRELPHSLDEGGDFLYFGAGYFPQALIVAADAFVRSAEQDLRKEQRLTLDKDRFSRFQQALQETIAEVNSFELVKHPGGKSEGLLTNDFVVVRATTAKAFVDKASYAMRMWNTMNREAKSGNPLIFDVQELKVNARDATQYSLDVASAEGPAIPETRQIMEAFFGPGGKYQLWLVPVDEHNVIFASATENEIKTALEALDRKHPIAWDAAPLADANQLLPSDADWRFFFNLRPYVAWSQKHSAAMTGPVFGGHPNRAFPRSPPIALAGRTTETEISATAVIPAATLQSAGEYLKK